MGQRCQRRFTFELADLAQPSRKRDSARTRERILAAAEEVFSTRDYTQARISDIAAEAGINQALVVRYFGSKDRLFETVLSDLLKANDVEGVPSHEEFGERIVRQLLGEADGPRDPLAMVIHAVSDPVAGAIARRLMEEQIFRPLARWLGGEAAESRAAGVLLLCAGLFTYRNLLPLAPLEGAMAPAARRWFQDALQALAVTPNPSITP